ncbi:MAG: nicotinate phosphoribosyltransferase, partial [Ruminococcaceae bacterium]|nr:nicotinate phosphoribosyltransferase [Oscillospiraceae bacterium]
YELPTIEEIRAHCKASLESMWDEVKRFDNPHNYYVDLSQKLWDLKYGMIKKQRHK